MARKLRLGLLLSLGCWLVAPTGLAGGADLRCTIDNRTVVRNVSLAAPADETAPLAPEPEPIPAPDYLAAEEACAEDCCAPACGPVPCVGWGQNWAGFEYLLWWRNGRWFPPLVTGDPGTLPAAPVLFGGEEVGTQARPGGRLEIGHWFDPGHCLGIGGHFVSLGESLEDFHLTTADLAFFARPYFNPDRTANAQVISNGTRLTGRLDLTTDSEFLASDVFARFALWRTPYSRLDLIAGYQFARIDEDLTISTSTQTLPVPPGTPSLAVTDVFATENEYHAGHFGLQGMYVMGCWGVELLAKFGFGNMRQEVAIDGTTSVTAQNNSTDVRDSGLLAQQLTNSSVHTQDVFSYMQEAGIKLAYCPTDHLKLSVGYSLMYWSSVARPGDHIDLIVDTTPLPGTVPTHPAFAFNPSNFLLHGLNCGLELRF